MAEATAETMKQEREEVYVALLYAAGFHCLVGEWKDCEELKPKPKEKWSFRGSKKRGDEASNRVVCGSRLKMPGRCTADHNSCPKVWENGEGAIWEAMSWSEEWTDRQEEVLTWCRKCSGYARQRMGPKLINGCMPEQMGTKEFGKILKRIQTLKDGGVPAKETKNWRIEGEKKRFTRKENQRLLNKSENGRFNGVKRLVELGKGANHERKKRIA